MKLADSLDITREQADVVQAFLQRFVPETRVWAYGSRVTGKSSASSDLDLVVFSSEEQSASVSELREAFEESNLPFRVDLFVWDQVPETFKPNILKDHTVIQG